MIVTKEHLRISTDSLGKHLRNVYFEQKAVQDKVVLSIC